MNWIVPNLAIGNRVRPWNHTLGAVLVALELLRAHFCCFAVDIRIQQQPAGLDNSSLMGRIHMYFFCQLLICWYVQVGAFVGVLAIGGLIVYVATRIPPPQSSKATTPAAVHVEEKGLSFSAETASILLFFGAIHGQYQPAGLDLPIINGPHPCVFFAVLLISYLLICIGGPRVRCACHRRPHHIRPRTYTASAE